MGVTPESQIHHLKEALEEDSPKRKLPLYLLILFVLFVAAGALIYGYFYRDLPRCSDESIQILLNENLRSNESLINDSQTLEFANFKQTSQDGVQRNCMVDLVTNKVGYRVSYRIMNELQKQSVYGRIFGVANYVVIVQGVELAQ